MKTMRQLKQAAEAFTSFAMPILEIEVFDDFDDLDEDYIPCNRIVDLTNPNSLLQFKGKFLKLINEDNLILNTDEIELDLYNNTKIMNNLMGILLSRSKIKPDLTIYNPVMDETVDINTCGEVTSHYYINGIGGKGMCEVAISMPDGNTKKVCSGQYYNHSLRMLDLLCRLKNKPHMINKFADLDEETSCNSNYRGTKKK